MKIDGKREREREGRHQRCNVGVKTVNVSVLRMTTEEYG